MHKHIYIHIYIYTCSPDDAVNLTVAYLVYHAVKNNFSTLSAKALRDRDFAELAASTKGEACAAVRVVLPMMQVHLHTSSLQTEEPHTAIRRPHLFDVAAPSGPRFVAATVSNTRFVPGGDHFMTTSFKSSATAESAPVTREEFFADCVDR